ncbi:ABC transporter ATP-binding protein [Arthrobacter sp. MYb227]|uniref:adenylate/guanylate cyclase domain-containing protein n=1 Tax=Arthrobacter sp. MYb227 TaxID=1848601 RepID=UPI000CFA8DD8|nr:adenylate/guanylate cyclase domain-containing protein [Arthrobacter sp. MYb227]PQZ86718.1 ABC transporter ATP-binding protein [Arthrobacter sp. MYb227]
MLIANSLAIAGRHQPLLEPTSLTVSRGELLLVQAEPQPTRTALSLGLSARMRPGAGTVSWAGNSSLRSVRKISTLIDSPEINEPEAHLKVRDLVAEDLALQPGPRWRRSSINSWMERHKVDHLAGNWLDAIDPLDRFLLLTYLSLDDSNVKLAIFDSPDRHGIPEEDWIAHLKNVAGGRRAPAVIAVVARIPMCWDGAVAFAGHTQTHRIFARDPKPEVVSQKTTAPETREPLPDEPSTIVESTDVMEPVKEILETEQAPPTLATEYPTKALRPENSVPEDSVQAKDSTPDSPGQGLAQEVKETR